MSDGGTTGESRRDGRPWAILLTFLSRRLQSSAGESEGLHQLPWVETDKAMQIFKTCLDENGVLTDESCPLLAQNNQDLACLIFNYIKCNCVANMHGSMTSADYL